MRRRLEELRRERDVSMTKFGCFFLFGGELYLHFLRNKPPSQAATRLETMRIGSFLISSIAGNGLG
jgi:hypothetical protein